MLSGSHTVLSLIVAPGDQDQFLRGAIIKIPKFQIQILDKNCRNAIRNNIVELHILCSSGEIMLF